MTEKEFSSQSAFGSNIAQADQGGKATVNVTYEAPPVPTLATAPAPPIVFTGRRRDLDDLKVALIARQNLALHGMGGIGKTAIAQKLATELENEFPGGVFWGSLVDHDGNPRPIMRAWGLACGQDLHSVTDPYSLASLVRGLLSARRAELGSLFIIIDDVREQWLKVAQQLQTAVPAKTPLLQTTRDERLASALGATVYHLDVLSPSEALALLTMLAQDFVVETETESAEALLKTVGYLPLAIELAGKQLAVRARKPGYRLETLRQAVSERAASALTFKGHPGLAATFAITYEAQTAEIQRLFSWLGIFAPGPLNLAGVAGVLGWEVNKADMMLDLLVTPAMLEYGKRTEIYTLHPLLSQYAKTLLSQGGEEEKAKQCHLKYYLAFAKANAKSLPAAHDQLEAALPNLLQAVDIAIQFGDHQAVSEFGLALYGKSYFLDIRGYVRESLELLTQSVTASQAMGDRKKEGVHLGNLGIAYRTVGQVPRAIECHEKSLTIAREIGDKWGEGNQLGNLGTAYRTLGQEERAISYHEQALAIACEEGLKRGEGIELGNLGLAYHALEQVERAIEYHEQSLAIAKEKGYQRLEGSALGNLGRAYRSLGMVEKAIAYFQQALSIDQKLGDRRGEGIHLSSLGNAYLDLKEVRQAIGYHDQALAITRETGDRRGEGNALGNLGIAYRDLGQRDRSMEFHRQALAIAQEIHDRRGEANHSWNLGLLLEEEDPALAVKLMNVRIDYKRKAGLPNAEADVERVAQIQVRARGDKRG